MGEEGQHWLAFQESSDVREMPDSIVASDDYAGLKAARSAALSGAPWRRFPFDTTRNPMADLPIPFETNSDALQDGPSIGDQSMLVRKLLCR